MAVVAVYGGSFNPPHVGHAMVASWVRWTGRADEVWFVPVFGHAFAKSLAPFDARVAMCRALDLGAWMRVSEVERALPVPSYSIQTLSHLAAAHPEHRFRFVVGADVLPEVGRWRAWDRIAQDFDPIWVGRQGYPTPPGAVDFPGISSTAVREAARTGAPYDHWVPASVRAAVAQWYGPDAGAAPPTDESTP